MGGSKMSDLSLSCAVEKIYSKKNELIILGLTGKTGSGCTKTASILKKEKVDDLDLREAHTQGKTDAECRKYSICKKFMEYDKHWTGFSVIEASSIIFLFVLENTIQGLIDYLSEITHAESNNIIQIGDLNKVTDIIKSLDYMYTEARKFNINNLNKSSSNYSNDLNNYYLFYTKTISEYRDRFESCFHSSHVILLTKQN